MQAWDQFLEVQEKELGKDTISRWLRPIMIEKFDACNLYLKAENSFQVLWFEEHIRPKLKDKFLNNNGRPIKVHLKQINNRAPKKKNFFRPNKALEIKQNFLDPLLTWDTFLPNSGNFVPSKLLLELSNSTENTQKDFNPIFIHGETGVGKTHLLTAYAHSLKKKGINVFFVRAESFTEHVVNAIRLGMMQEFRKAYRNIDVLIIDDIHIFSKKAATQE